MLEKQLFTYDGRFPSRNDATRADRAHWAVGAALKKKHTEAVYWSIKAQKIKPVTGKTRMTITFYERDYRRDEDNIISGLKYLLDGIVMAQIIPNDTRKHLQLKIEPIQVDKERPRVEVLIEKEG